LKKFQSTLDEINVPTINLNSKLLEDITIKNNNFDFPIVNDILPHLRGKSVNLSPNVIASKNKNATFVIGIPSIKREENYLYDTIKSILNSMKEFDKRETVIVIMLAEVIYD
jgi:hypothetical protein